MSYEKHIEYLENQLAEYPDKTGAYTVAIELMRAAEPKDEAAEREHCDKAADDIVFGEHNKVVHDEIALRMQTERAAARAEVEAKYAALLAPKDEAAEWAHCARQQLEAVSLLKYPQAAKILNVCKRTVMRLADRGELERVRIRGASFVTGTSVLKLIANGRES